MSNPIKNKTKDPVAWKDVIIDDIEDDDDPLSVFLI